MVVGYKDILPTHHRPKGQSLWLSGNRQAYSPLGTKRHKKKRKHKRATKKKENKRNDKKRKTAQICDDREVTISRSSQNRASWDRDPPPIKGDSTEKSTRQATKEVRKS
jgi:hypothetical protein